MHVILGNISAVEFKALNVVEADDPDLDAKVTRAVAAGLMSAKVDGEDGEDQSVADNATLAARLSAVKTQLTLPHCQETVIDWPHDDVDEWMTMLKTIVPGHFAPGTGPVWVESDDDFLAQSIARKFSCPVGRPDDWEQGAQVSRKAAAKMTKKDD